MKDIVKLHPDVRQKQKREMYYCIGIGGTGGLVAMVDGGGVAVAELTVGRGSAPGGDM